MRKWTTTAGLLFCAAASVYSSQAVGAKGPKAGKPAGQTLPTDVTLLESKSDPFAADPSTQPSSQPSTHPTAAAIEPGGPAAPLQMNSDGTFSLNIVNGADLVEQLRVIGFQAQMSIIPSKEVRGAMPAVDLYNVTVTEALDALLHANGYAWRQKGNFVYVYSAKELDEMEKAQRVLNTEVFHLYYTPAANAVNMIKPVLSSDGQVSFTTPALSGIESGAKDVGGNSHATDDLLVVSDYPENLDRIRAVLREVDRRPQQILIEATILRATLQEGNQLGVDFNVVGGVDFSTITSSNGQITNAGLPAVTGGDDVNSVGTGNAFTGPIAGGLKVGVVSNNVSVFLAALEDVEDTVILANPKVLALNKQKGEIIVGRKDGYITTTQTETTSTQTVEFLDTGTRLIFRPYIGDDGFIRMEIHPEDSSGGVNSDGLPSKVTTEVTSNVMIKDGHTIVIGGLFRESTSTVRSQVPVLGNIPLLGHLFRNQNDQTTREEVIILITPHIVKDDSVYAQMSEDEMRNAEKLRVGARRGMMFWGRERMADLYYNCAVKELSKSSPDRKKAIFYLDAATGLNPTFIDAINLKQDLTGREVTSADGSTIRSFVRRAMLIDRGPATRPSDDDNDVDAFVPSTQPYAYGEHTHTHSPATQPVASALPFEFNGVGFQPATGPTEGLSFVDPCEDCETVSPLAETDMELPSYDPLAEYGSPSTTPSRLPVARNDAWLLPSSQPVARRSTTQPSQADGGFGVRGLGAAMGEMLKNDKDATTELPTEELDGDDNK